MIQPRLRASLFTNGIRATRELLAELCEAGLTDVAFHVDLTQERKGLATESALNELRDKYIERARGLPLSVFFNTTVFEKNLEEIPDVVRFLASRAEVVRAASFQLQADTGCGVLGKRPEAVTVASVEERIQRGAGAKLDFDAFHVGHAACNRYAMAWVINGRLRDAYSDREFVRRFMQRTANVRIPRKTRRAAVGAVALAVAARPDLWWPSMRWLAQNLSRARRDLVASRGRIRKISILHSQLHGCRRAGSRARARVRLHGGDAGWAALHVRLQRAKG